MTKLPKFRANITWLRQSTESLGYAKEASQIKINWCWKEIGKWSKEIPEDLHERLVQAMIESGDGIACYCYCRHVKDRQDVRQAMIDSGNGFACYRYCRDIEDRDDVRQALIESGDGNSCYWYCDNIEDRDDVRAVFEKI